jgi:hypothetical protein
MPFCLPIIAAAAAVASAGAGVAGQQKAKSAMNQMTMAELLRQRGIQDKASSAFAESLSQSGKDTADSQIQQGQEQRESGYNAAQAVPLSAGSAPLVGGNSAVLNLQDQAQLSQSNRSRAKMGSYDKWQLDQMVKNVRAGQQQGMLGQQAQRSQAILPMELQDASHKGDAWNNASSILGLVSSLASLGSMAGVGAGAQAAPQSALLAGQGPVTAGWAAANPGLMHAGYAAQAANAARAASTAQMFGLAGNMGIAGMNAGNYYGIKR